MRRRRRRTRLLRLLVSLLAVLIVVDHRRGAGTRRRPPDARRRRAAASPVGAMMTLFLRGLLRGVWPSEDVRSEPEGEAMALVGMSRHSAFEVVIAKSAAHRGRRRGRAGRAARSRVVRLLVSTHGLDKGEENDGISAGGWGVMEYTGSAVSASFICTLMRLTS